MTNQTHWTQWPESKLHELVNWVYSLVTTPQDFTSQLEPFDSRVRSFFFDDGFLVKFRCPRNLEDLSDEGKTGILLFVSFESAAYLYGLVLVDPHTVQAIIDTNVQAAISQAIPIPPSGCYPLYFFDPRIMEETHA